jgi:starch synthase
MYAKRYGSIPVVRSTGGLKNTVADFSEKDGYGVLFKEANLNDSLEALERAMNCWEDRNFWLLNLERLMSQNHSWVASAKSYKAYYKAAINLIKK